MFSTIHEIFTYLKPSVFPNLRLVLVIVDFAHTHSLPVNDRNVGKEILPKQSIFYEVSYKFASHNSCSS